MSFRFLLVVVFLGAALAGAIAVLYTGSPASKLEFRAGTALDQPRPITEFELVDHRGQPFRRADLQGRWSLLFAGFTNCPDICPATLMQLDSVDTRLRAANGGLQTVFLSVDPERDTPGKLAEYVEFFNPGFIGVTGQKPEIDRLCDDLGLAYIKIPQSEGRYTVDHSAAVVLIDPQARVAAYFTQPLDVVEMADDLVALPGG